MSDFKKVREIVGTNNDDINITSWYKKGNLQI